MSMFIVMKLFGGRVQCIPNKGYNTIIMIIYIPNKGHGYIFV